MKLALTLCLLLAGCADAFSDPQANMLAAQSLQGFGYQMMNTYRPAPNTITNCSPWAGGVTCTSSGY